MRMPRFAKVLVAFLVRVMLVQLLHACSTSQAAEKTRPVVWVMLGEMFNNTIRGAALSVAASVQ